MTGAVAEPLRLAMCGTATVKDRRVAYHKAHGSFIPSLMKQYKKKIKKKVTVKRKSVKIS